MKVNDETLYKLYKAGIPRYRIVRKLAISIQRLDMVLIDRSLQHGDNLDIPEINFQCSILGKSKSFCKKLQKALRNNGYTNINTCWRNIRYDDLLSLNGIGKESAYIIWLAQNTSSKAVDQ